MLALIIGSSTRAMQIDSLSYPTVGKPMPDLMIRNISYYSKKNASIRQFRGKWLLLDFWDIHCGACIGAFPRMSRIQQMFGQRLQVMMVGVQDPENKIQPMFAKYREREHLTFPCAFDSALAQRLDIYYVPHLIVIDDKGIVRSIVVGIDTGSVRAFLEGRSPQLKQTYSRMKDYETPHVDNSIPFNNKKPFLVEGNGGNDSVFLYRSLLSNWTIGVHRLFMPDSMGSAVRKGQWQVLGAPVDLLYHYAFYGMSGWGPADTLLYGKYYDHIIHEVRDSSLFDYSRRYCYSQIRPVIGNSLRRMQLTMQRDLENFFGFRADFEIRKCSYWKMIALPGALERLRTRGGKPFSRELSMRVGWTMGNLPMEKLIGEIRGHDPGRDPLTDIYLNETRITENIDITLDCILSDLDDLRAALRANGLDLIKGEKEMKVLVIREGSE